ncbi:aspartate aminotransferase family protein [Methylophilaceae bacterium]|nr:aspartate aminotransferase family protein [Methylophilaceae bacterium]
MNKNLMPTYNRFPISFEKGKGVWVFDKNNTKYLDGLSGIAVNTLGHNHSDLVRAISKQAAKLIHISNYYHIEEQSVLADRLVSLSKLSSVFFCNSGCEANEAAIKLARLHGHKLGIDSPNIIVMEGGFHGRTMGTLSASGGRKYQAGFEPLMSGYIRVPFDDIDAVEKISAKNNKVSAIFIEPIQGEGGINIPKNLKQYLKKLRQICDQNRWLLIFDEVQCGVGRTGKWFAHQHSSVKPDVMTLAKGLGSGMPIGACIANKTATKLMEPGKHGSTFGGNPLACSAGIATLNAIEKEHLIKNAIEQGLLITNILKENFKNNKNIISIRSLGLMIGIELSVPCGDCVNIALDKKLLINVTAGNVIRLLPPLIINKREAKILSDRLIFTIESFINNL